MPYSKQYIIFYIVVPLLVMILTRETHQRLFGRPLEHNGKTGSIYTIVTAMFWIALALSTASTLLAPLCRIILMPLTLMYLLSYLLLATYPMGRTAADWKQFTWYLIYSSSYTSLAMYTFFAGLIIDITELAPFSARLALISVIVGVFLTATLVATQISKEASPTACQDHNTDTQDKE